MAETYAIAGRVSIVPKGEWDTETTYQRLDLVTYNGRAYLAKRTSIGYEPIDGDDWMFLFETSGIATETEAGIVIPDNLTILIDGNGEISVQNMVGATETEDGKAGLVPKPTSSDRNKALFGDGTYKEVTVDVDTEMSDESENPVQNKVVKRYVDDKLITKADNITYDEDTSELQLKSGDEVLSTVIIEGGGGTPPFMKMTAVIDLSNSNPTSSVTYANDAVGMEVGSSDWDDFFGHYPCLLKNGVEVGKLQRNNFDKFENGSTADISSGNAGDAMIAFPRRGLSIKTVGTKIYVSMTDDPDNADFEYNAHTKGTTRKEKFYLGVYKGYEATGRLRSVKGNTPAVNKTIGTFRTQAQANGSGYEQSGFYQLLFIQCMFILKYKTLNSQSAVGRGFVDDNSAAIGTGGTETWGMDSEIIRSTNPSYLTDGKHHIKLFGIEDFWGNVYEWIDGLVSDSSRNVLTANDNFNDSGSGYTNNGNGGISSDIFGYMSKPQGSTKSGFVISESNGSETTYFCDYGRLSASRVAYFGGSWGRGSDAGAFRLDVVDTASFSSADVGARLMFL